MQVNTKQSKNIRFNACLSVEQKDYFERAAQLGGYSNLTEFIISTLMEKANKIIIGNEQVLASQRDNEIFFEAVFQQTQPNDALVEAVNMYKHIPSE
jgi:uncharacterized protein (DUF1778 family)